MLKVITLLSLFVTQNMFAQSIGFGWAKSFNGVNQEVGKAIATDATGNIYTAGYFTGTVDFDPGANTMMLSSAGQQDLFISKLDATGNFVWAKRIGSVGNDIATSIALDAVGNVYCTGFFHSNVDFDPGNAIANLTGATINSQDIFVLKLNASGNFCWAKSFGGSGYYDAFNNLYDAVSTGYAIQVDAACNVYTTGGFLGTIDFNPGNALYNMASLSVSNIFISKLDSSGNFLWAKAMGENKMGDEAYSITIDTSCNVYTTGVFGDTADFDPGPAEYSLISTAYTSAFILKLDAAGNFVWAKKMGGNTATDQATGFSIVLDANGNIYTAGNFKGNADFDPGVSTNIVSSSGNTDIFISKLNNAGDFSWAKKFGGTSSDYCYSLAVDANQFVYTVGSFKGTVDFNPGNDTVFMTSTLPATSDIFISRLNAAGDFINAYQIGGPGNDLANTIRLDAGGNLFITGYYSNAVDFDPGQNVCNLISSGSVDAFVLAMHQNGFTLPVSLKDFYGMEIKEGNLLKWETENETNASHYEIEKSADGIHFSMIGIVKCLVNATTKSDYSFVDNTMSNTINYYRLKQVDLDGKYMLSRIIEINNKDVNDGMTVFPNPSGGELTILLNHEIKNGILKIKDCNGNILAEKRNINGQSFFFDSSSLSNGIYFIEIERRDTEKDLIKNNKMNIKKIQLMK